MKCLQPAALRCCSAPAVLAFRVIRSSLRSSSGLRLPLLLLQLGPKLLLQLYSWGQSDQSDFHLRIWRHLKLHEHMLEIRGV